MRLQSYLAGSWQGGGGRAALLRDASTGAVIAEAASEGLDFASALRHARDVGGPALRAMTFRERAAMLRTLGKRLLDFKPEFYALSHATGATRGDSWIDIDGGIGTMLVFASKGARELPDGHVYLDGGLEPLSKGGSFVGQHVCVPLEGAAVHINAFNFPVWGMLEKLAPALLAGVPAIVKPATATSYLTELVVRRIVESSLLPAGALQLICGGVGDLFDHLGCQDIVSFTGSAATAARLRTHPAVVRHAVRFVAETDSLNSSILGPDAAPGTPEFTLFVQEVAREMTVKAGQKCTAIRKAIVPKAWTGEVVAALQAKLAETVVGDPRTPGVGMGPLASLAQRDEVLARIGELERECERVAGDPDRFEVSGADRRGGAFLPPILLLCRDAAGARALHAVEAFGPVSTIVGYEDIPDAIALARRGDGSLAGSVFTADDKAAARLVLGLAPWHGRIVWGSAKVHDQSPGSGTVLPNLVHGGPGKAGGG
ncbi:MAG TPA: phenylacetic acid degradation bifunctional protein PaaZ, partial [Steroidobacteraceae bacterium]|nr:phenylacetic acid degradation bifunctional protein PaaZ [Steroidobacteraceae bacterium]